ncbi:MAG: hypothetical protein ACP5K8_08245 [Nitrososphaeria archaeon]
MNHVCNVGYGGRSPQAQLQPISCPGLPALPAIQTITITMKGIHKIFGFHPLPYGRGRLGR